MDLNRFRWATCLALAVTMASPPSWAGNTLTVYSEGIGDDKNTAIQKALRSAIEEHLGMFLSAESLVKDKALVSEQVTTYSKGFVKSYELIAADQEGKGWRVRLAAELSPDRILEAFSKVPSVKINGTLDFINLQLEQERRNSALKIATEVIEQLTHDGYEVKLGKTEYVPDEQSPGNARFLIPAKVKPRDQVWDSALKVLKRINPGDTATSFNTVGYTKNGNPETRESIGIYPKVCALLESFDPSIILEIQDQNQKPLQVGMLSLRGLNIHSVGGGCGVRVVIEKPPTHAQTPSKPKYSMETTFVGRTPSEEVRAFAEVKAEVLSTKEVKARMESTIPGSTTDTRAFPDLVSSPKEVRPLYRVDPLGIQVIILGHKVFARNRSAVQWKDCQFFLKDEKQELMSLAFPQLVPPQATVILDETETTPASWEMTCGVCSEEDGHTECSGGRSEGLLQAAPRRSVLLKDAFIDGAGRPVNAKKVFTGHLKESPNGNRGPESASHSDFPVLPSGSDPGGF